MRTCLAALAVLLAAFPTAAHAGPGDLDTDFGTAGITLSSVGGGESGASAHHATHMVQQPDGRLVVNGGSNAMLGATRFTANGALDTTFNPTGPTPGSVTTTIGSGASANGIGLQSDGKIIVAGYGGASGVHVARYTANGVLDTSFNPTGSPAGVVSVPISAPSGFGSPAGVAVASDGRIVISGTAQQSTDPTPFVFRLTASGALDTTFNAGGTQPGVRIFPGTFGDNRTHNALALDASDRPVLVGQKTVRRLTTSGADDPTFAPPATMATFNDVTIDSAGKILAVGSRTTDQTRIVFARYLPDGTADPALGAGVATLGELNAVALDSAGHIVVSGLRGSTHLFTRYSAGGGTDVGPVLTPIGDGNNSFADDVVIAGGDLPVTAGRAVDGGQSKLSLARFGGTNQSPTAVATFAPANPRQGQTVTFDGSTSSDPDGSIVSYEWDLDGVAGYEAGGATPSHVYTTPGSRIVALRVTDNRGAVAQATRTFTVIANQAPTGSFTVTPTPVLRGRTTTLDATASSDPDGTIATYQWDYTSDGTYDTEPSATPTTTHAYTALGSTQAKLRIVDNEGGETIVTQTFSVGNQPPEATFGALPSRRTVAFDASASVDPDGTVTRYAWDFTDDGFIDRTVTVPTTSFTYPVSGTYTTRLVVTDSNDTTAETTRSVAVSTTAPSAVLAIDNTRPQPQFDVVTFSAAGSADSDGGTIASYRWDLDGNGSFETTTGGPSASKVYTAEGAVTVSLKVVDDDGLESAAVTGTVTVENKAPVASFAADVGDRTAVGTTALFTATASDPDGDGSIAKYEWDFRGTGAFVQANRVAGHAYTAPGVFTVALRVTDGLGKSTTVRRTLTVVADAAPTVSLTGGGTVPPGVTVPFDASGSLGSALTYAWAVDGVPLQLRGPRIEQVFRTPGNHKVTVTAVDAQGRNATASATVTVTSPPAVYLSVPDGRVPYGKDVNITLKALTEPGAEIAYTTWRFDGTSGGGGKRSAPAPVARAAAIKTKLPGGFGYEFPEYSASPNSTLVKGLSLRHTFQKDKPTGFTVTAHQNDGQVLVVTGEVKRSTPQFGVFNAFSVAGYDSPYPSTGRGTVLEDISTDGVRGLVKKCKEFVNEMKVCVDVEGYPAGTSSSHVLEGFNTGDGHCGGFCKAEELPNNLGFRNTKKTLLVNYDKPGTYSVTMRVTRDETVEEVTRPIEVLDSVCGAAAQFRGINLGTGCFPKLMDPSTGAEILLGYKEQDFGGLTLSAGRPLQFHRDSGLVTTGPAGGDISVRYGPFALARVPAFVMPQVGPGGADLPDTLTTQLKGQFVEGLPVVGAKARVFPASPTQITFALQLPKPFGGTAEFVRTQAASRRSLRAADFGIRVPAMSFGPVSIGETVLARDGQLLHGGTSLDIFGATIDASDAPSALPFPTGVGVLSGGFKYAGANVTLPTPIILHPAVKLTRIGAGIGLKPFRFTGTGTLASNVPQIDGEEVVEADACLALILASASDPAQQEPWCAARYTGTSTAIRADAGVKILGSPFGNGYLQYVVGSEVAFGGDFGYRLPVPLAKIVARGRLDGRFASASDWQVSSGVKIEQDIFCIPFTDECLEPGGSVGISDSGIAACGEVAFGKGVGGFYRWANADYGLFAGSCDSKVADNIARSLTSPIARLVAGPGADGAAVGAFGAAASESVTLPGGLPDVMLLVDGAGDRAPNVTVRGPGGVTIEAATSFDGKGSAVFESRATGQAVVLIRKPRAGRYTVTTAEGSDPITAIERVDGLAEPKVSARVAGADKGRLALRYRVAPIPGQTVWFADGSGQKIGVVKGRSGTLRFRPGATPEPMTRKVTAMVEQYGLPRENLTVASYKIKPVRLGKVRRLKVAIKGPKGRVSWQKASGASSYSVRIERTDGAVLDLRTRRTSIGFAATSSATGARVTVRALDTTGREGKPAVARRKPRLPRRFRL